MTKYNINVALLPFYKWHIARIDNMYTNGLSTQKAHSLAEADFYPTLRVQHALNVKRLTTMAQLVGLDQA